MSAIFKNVTSVGLTKDNNMNIIALSYDEIDATTGERVKLNCKTSRVIMPSNTEVINAIASINKMAQSIADSTS